jgi:hypothetical protein
MGDSCVSLNTCSGQKCLTLAKILVHSFCRKLHIRELKEKYNYLPFQKSNKQPTVETNTVLTL